jgi:hypothetical protein
MEFFFTPYIMEDNKTERFVISADSLPDAISTAKMYMDARFAGHNHGWLWEKKVTDEQVSAVCAQSQYNWVADLQLRGGDVYASHITWVRTSKSILEGVEHFECDPLPLEVAQTTTTLRLIAPKKQAVQLPANMRGLRPLLMVQ